MIEQNYRYGVVIIGNFEDIILLQRYIETQISDLNLEIIDERKGTSKIFLSSSNNGNEQGSQ